MQNHPTVNVETVQPLHHAQPQQQQQHKMMAPGHSEMGGKALLAKKMAASGQSFYSPTDRMVSPCTAKLHLAKKKHFAKGKPVALSSSFATSNNNPLQPVNQNIPLTSEGFLHPSHAKQAQFTLAHQAKAGTPLSEESKPVQQTTNKQQQSAVEDHAAEDDDEEMEM